MSIPSIRVPNLVPIGPDIFSTCLLYVWPPNPLQIPRGAREVNFFSRFPFPDQSAYVCQIWPRSVQWFATGPSVTAKVSSVFCRSWCWLAQKHTQKQHLYIENYNSGQNMLTSLSLTFFTAIFLAFRGSLVEVLGNVPICNNWIFYMIGLLHFWAQRLTSSTKSVNSTTQRQRTAYARE